MLNTIVRNGDVISGAVLAALGVYVFMEASGWSYMSEDGPGPGFFPAWYGIAMVVLSLALIVTAVRKAQTPEAVDWRAVGRALGTWLAFAVCAALMPWLGFLLGFAALSFFMVVVLFRQSVLRAGAVAICAAAGFYLVFSLALSVQLPVGWLGF